MVVGAAVVGAKVVGTMVVGTAVVGAMVVGAAVVGPAVVGAAVVGTMVVRTVTSQFTTVFPGLNTVLSAQGVASKTLFSSKDVTPCGITMDLMEVPTNAFLPIVSN